MSTIQLPKEPLGFVPVKTYLSVLFFSSPLTERIRSITILLSILNKLVHH